MKAFPRDIADVKDLKERHIGVENELKVRGAGVESQQMRKELDKHGLLSYIHFDGGGREFTTNPISIKSVLKQVRGRKYMSAYYEVLNENTDVVKTGGTHVHISILDSDHPDMEAHAVAIATAFHRQFQKIAGRNSHWATKIGVRSVAQAKEFVNRIRDHSGARRYHRSFNMITPSYHQTLEFRGPKGTKNVKEVLAWIDFLNNVVKAANKGNINGLKFGDLLKTKEIAEYVQSLPMTRRITSGEMNKTLNVNAL